jgi:cell surface hyaluronidase
MPVGFWTMNMWNELVGNKVVGVGGFGSCYWLLGSGVSGPSQNLQWSNSTTTPAGYANYNTASTIQAPVKRFRGNACSTSQYALQTTLGVDPPIVSAAQYGYTPVTNPYAITTDMLPNVAGDYLPVRIGGDACVNQRSTGDAKGGNATACALTLVDRFTTSFNWAPVDFGAVWLRPQFFAFTNGAVTDQLFGGLTFVSGGAWSQSPQGYFTITKDSIYSGTTQPGGVSNAGRAGPTLDIATCAANACPLPVDGTALFLDGFQPKRLINIYDGPFFAEGNPFTNAQAFACDPTKVTDGNPECGIYMTTVQPTSCASPPKVPPDEHTMCVINAAVGWKQPNGFYYPPAFAFENSAFDAESARHNVVDLYNGYIQGTVLSPSAPSIFNPLQTYTGLTPIDSSTILNDLDGTFTGNCWGADCDALSLPSPQRRTSSVSANRFFDAPSQSPECLSYGVQTSPNDFLTTVIAPLTADGTAIDPTVWNTAIPFPAVPIYRQRLLADEQPCAGAICDGTTWSCDHATFMMGAQNGQVPYLTTSDGVYYIDTDTAGQTTSCIPGTNYSPAPFTAGSQYVLYQLFARDDSQTTYQLYTGGAVDGAWVWVQPHVTSPTAPSNNMVVDEITDPTLLAELNPLVTQAAGMLEITFDSSVIADQFPFTARADDDKCLPRDACQVATDGSQCELASGFAETDLQATVGGICETWATRVAGTTPTSQGLSLSDCPASGCLGYRFELPTPFIPQSYAEVGAPRVNCFPDDSVWNRPLQVISQDVSACAAPPPPSGFGVCPAQTPTPTMDE